MACSLAGFNYISVSSIVIYEFNHILPWIGYSLDSDTAITASRLIFLFVCFSCLGFTNVLVWVADNFLNRVF